jgi:hypothetical protein
MARNGTAHLSLAEAHHAAQTFLAYVGFVPTRVDEPVDGVIELEGSDFIARVKYEQDQVGQGALIALIKAAGDEQRSRILLSATGFSSSVRSLAETHAIALFDIDLDGDMVASSACARTMMPDEQFVAPFADPTAASFSEDAANPFARVPDARVIEDHEWLECPTCATTHHPDADFCVGCGGSVISRGELGSAGASGKAVGDRALATNPVTGAVADPESTGGPAQLKCRTCGSHDIALVGT